MEVIREIFSISYKVLRRLDDNNELQLNKWVEIRNETYLALNELVFRRVGELQFATTLIDADAVRQLILNSLSEVAEDHIKVRLKIYHLCRSLKLLNVNLYCFISFICFYIKTISKVLKGTVFSLKSYSLKSINIDPAVRIVIAVGFPRHSFSLEKNQFKSTEENGKFYPSFAEYLKDTHITKEDRVKLISCNEYERLSKEKENDSHFVNSVADVPVTLDRIKLAPKFLPARIISRVFLAGGMLRSCIFTSRQCFSVGIFYYISWCRSIGLNEIFAKLDDRIDAIYALPFSNKLGVIPVEKNKNRKLIFYNYSHNMGVPPNSFLHRCNEYSSKFKLEVAMAEMPPTLWRISGEAVGFTDIYEYLNSFRIYLNSHFGYRLPLNTGRQSPQKPVMIGFERKQNSISEKKDIRYVLVFDVPPETPEEYFGSHFAGNHLGQFEVVKSFIDEVLDVCIERDFKVLLKPKYSLSNYVPEYGEYLSELSTTHENSFEVLDPYASIGPAISLAVASIAMPYTSIKLVGDCAGVKSTYYLPDQFKYNDDGTTLFGRSELSSFLEKV